MVDNVGLAVTVGTVTRGCEVGARTGAVKLLVDGVTGLSRAAERLCTVLALYETESISKEAACSIG